MNTDSPAHSLCSFASTFFFAWRNFALADAREEQTGAEPMAPPRLHPTSQSKQLIFQLNPQTQIKMKFVNSALFFLAAASTASAFVPARKSHFSV